VYGEYIGKDLYFEPAPSFRKPRKLGTPRLKLIDPFQSYTSREMCPTHPTLPDVAYPVGKTVWKFFYGAISKTNAVSWPYQDKGEITALQLARSPYNSFASAFTPEFMEGGVWTIAVT